MSALKDLNLDLSQRASHARKAASISLKDAAEHLGFKNYQTLSEIEKGKRNTVTDLMLKKD